MTDTNKAARDCLVVAICTLAWAMAGCAGGPAGPAARPETPVAEKTAPIWENAGKQMTLTGRITGIQWQHLIMSVPGKSHIYLDIPGNQQIVVYVKGTVNCPGAVRVTGTVIPASSGPKRHGAEKDRKEIYEYHLDADRWECAEP
jgi:hypothetical protein